MIIPSPVSRRKARIEIIPLIDIIFFLLATFMMISLSMIKHRGVDVNLATAATASQQVKDSRYTTVSVTRDGGLFFNKEKISFEQLSERLISLKAGESNPKVVLTADRGAEYGTAITALDQIRKNGIKEVVLQTQLPPQE